MPTNDILPFAQGPGANLLSQAAYLADAQRLAGNQPGIARAQLNNKALLQASLVAAAVAQFVTDRQVNNITDLLTPATLAGYLALALKQAHVADQQANQLLVPTSGYLKLPGGLIMQWGAGIIPGPVANRYSTVAVTYPVAFPTAPVYVGLIPTNQGSSGGSWPICGTPGGTVAGFTLSGSLPTGVNWDNSVTVWWFALGY